MKKKTKKKLIRLCIVTAIALCLFATASILDIQIGSEEDIVPEVDMIMIGSGLCVECFPLSQITNTVIENQDKVGIKIMNTYGIDESNPPAQDLIKKYNIKRVPTFLLSQEAWESETFREKWGIIGTREEDGMLVYRAVPPPFIDTDAKVLRGLVNITNVIDPECSECFDVSRVENTMKLGGIVVKNVRTFNITSDTGEMLAERYGVDRVPFVILSQDIEFYELFVAGLGGNVTQEFDKNFVIRGSLEPFKEI